jgi:phosphatidylglycerol:prolipoprotein diacylglycerol transferase
MNMLTLLSINWNPNPELFNLFSSLPIRYYGLLWVVGIALAYVIVHRQYHDRKIDEKTFEPLFFYCFFGILVGARLGHCLFYQPDYYLNHFWEMILPVKFLPDGGWKFTGYEGLASHGGTLGLIIALWMYCRKTKMHYMDVLDMIAVATPVTACCIRLANLMNSEIIGKPADVPWAFVFERVDMLPRHPAQLYEAIAYFIFFLGMVYLYRRGQKQQENKLKTDFSTTKAKSTAVQTGATLPYHRGFFFGLCLTEIFVFRFFIEFLKEDQVDFESAMTLNMGQWLSIPFILIGVYFMCFHDKKTAGK